MFGGLLLKDAKLCPLLALIAVSKIEDLSVLELPSDYNKECFARVWEYVQSLKANQLSFFRFLLELSVSTAYLGPNQGYSTKPEVMAIILQAMDDTLNSPIQDESISTLRTIAKRALFVPRSISAMYAPSSPPGKAGPAVANPAMTLLTRYGNHVHNKAVTTLAMKRVTGQSNLSLLSCAQSTSGNEPAIGRRPMYID